MSNIQRDDPEFPVGKRIKYFREKKGITTNKLANLSGISQSYLRDVELQNKNPTIEIIYLLCKALGVSLKQFFDDESTVALSEDPLVQQIYRLNEKQRESLLAFLNSMT